MKKITEKKENPSGNCIHCGCTDYDCSQCIERTGTPCYWVNEEETICSACSDFTLNKTKQDNDTII